MPEERDKGKVIFYSVSHFAFDMSAKVRAERIKERPEENAFSIKFHRYRGETEPEYRDKFDFPVDNRKSMIVKCLISGKRIEKVSFLPVLINRYAQPAVVPRHDKEFGAIMDYVAGASKAVGYDTKLTAEGNEIGVCI